MESKKEKKVRVIACTGGTWENVRGILRYRPVGLAKRVIQLPLKNLTCSGLMTCVERKLDLSMEVGFRMTYEFPFSPFKNVVVDIADDEDVEVFLDLAVKSQRGLVTLYVVESGSCPEIHIETRNNGAFTYQNLFPECKTANVAGTSETHSKVEPVENMEEQGDFFGDEKEISYGSKAIKHPATLEKGVGKAGIDISWLSPPVTTPASKITPAATVSCNPEKGGNGKVSRDILWWMKPAPPDITPGEGFKMAEWSKTPKLFKNKEAFKMALKAKCLEEGFQMRKSISTKDRYAVRCASDTCNWRISGMKMQDSDMFEVKNAKLRHKCSRLKEPPISHPQANKKLKSDQLGSSYHLVDSNEEKGEEEDGKEGNSDSEEDGEDDDDSEEGGEGEDDDHGDCEDDDGVTDPDQAAEPVRVDPQPSRPKRKATKPKRLILKH